MKIIGEVNKLSEETLPKRLNEGEVVVYQILVGIKNPDDKQRAKIPILYPQSFTIPSKDRIKDQKTGKFVDIAIVENFQSIPGTNQFDIRPRKLAIPKSNNGYFYCTGGSAVDEEVYEYCELTNYNESNPNRDKSITPLFKRVDAVADSKIRSKKRSVLLQAMTYAQNMTEGEVKDFAAAMNWDERSDVGILRDKVETFAQESPDKFKDFVEDGNRDIQSIIKKAITTGKINFDPQGYRICLPNGQTLIKMDRVEGSDNYLKIAADWIVSSKNGQNTLATIKKALKNSDPE